ASGAFGRRPDSAGVQHAAYLSTGRRPNPALSALVCTGTRPQLDGGRKHRLPGCGRFHGARSVEAINLVRSPRRLHADELPGWTETSAGLVPFRKGAAS